MTLDGRVAVVTGAARGIGSATAKALAAAGADVAVNDLEHSSELRQTAEAIEGSGRRVYVHTGDVADVGVVEALVGQTVDALGRLDVAVANAAFSKRSLFYEADLETFRRTIDVTFWGSFYLVRGAAKQMIAAGQGGAIVAIGSPHAVLAVPRSMAYNAAKAAVDQMARTAAIELVEHRVRVNIVHPGWTDTPGERKHFSEQEIAAGGAKMPWGRLANPEEIGRAVVFLSDPASDYITGSTLQVDGGLSLPWWANRGSAIPE